jgi:RHS repeat-associated protein
MRKILFLLGCWLIGSISAQAQTISGATTVSSGQTVTYTLSIPSSLSCYALTAQWSVPSGGGTILSTSYNSITIRWDNAGSRTILAILTGPNICCPSCNYYGNGITLNVMVMAVSPQIVAEYPNLPAYQGCVKRYKVNNPQSGYTYKWYHATTNALLSTGTGLTCDYTPTSIGTSTFFVVWAVINGSQVPAPSGYGASVSSLPTPFILTNPNAVGTVSATTLSISNCTNNVTYLWEIYNAQNQLVNTGTSLVNSETLTSTYNLPSNLPIGDYTYKVSAPRQTCHQATGTLKVYQALNITSSGVVSTDGSTAYKDLNPITLTATAGYPNATYQWTLDGVNIAGANTNQIAADKVGTYRVIVNFSSGGQLTRSIEVKRNIAQQAMNFVIIRDIRKKGITHLSDVEKLNIPEMNETISYNDGLGRTIQQVITQGSIDQKDVVQPIVYDVDGLQRKSYAPYTEGNDGFYKPNAIQPNTYTQSNQYLYHQNTAKVSTANPYPYAETIFDNSPMSQVKEIGGIGQTWQIDKQAGVSTGNGKTEKYKTSFNTSKVRRLRYEFRTDNAESFGKITRKATDDYGAKTLIIKEAKHARNGQYDTYSYEYHNLQGQLIQKQFFYTNPNNQLDFGTLTTRYVYDDLGQLRVIIPPLAVDKMNAVLYQFSHDGSGEKDGLYDANTSNANLNDIFNTYCYLFHYDAKGRKIAQKQPGLGWAYMVYDRFDRAVLTQTPEQRTGIARWSFVKFDTWGREVVSGIYHTTASRASLQTTADASTVLGESILGSQVPDNAKYTNLAFPILGTADEIYRYTYYDHYNFTNEGQGNLSFQNHHPKLNALYDFPTPEDVSKLRGSLTGSKVKVLGKNQWLTTVSFYDKRGQIIQTQGQNHLGGWDVTTFQYAFDGTLVKTYHKHTVPNQPTVEVGEWNKIDHMGRILETYQQINDLPIETLSQYVYNPSGELIQKNVGATGNQQVPNSNFNDFLQHIDYKYNDVGSLTALNQTNDLGNDLFGMEWFSHQSQGFAQASQMTPQYTGNIAGIQWKSASDKALRSYNYQYDPVSRIKEAKYAVDKTQSPTPNRRQGEDYSTSDMQYDVNGNIIKMQRQGITQWNEGADPVYGTIDNLTYNHTGNQLKSVTDAATSTGVAGDFKDKTGAATEYTYNANGSLVYDHNKGINAIQYNDLNLPKTISFTTGESIQFLYDAAGNRLQTLLNNENGSPILSYDYVGAMVYVGDGVGKQPEMMHTSEGRFVFAPFVPVLTLGRYEYHITDHLGSLRVAFAKASPQTYQATMDKAPSDFSEEKTFMNVNKTKNAGWNHTPEGSQSSLTDNTKPLGPWKRLEVKKGDKIQANVWAKYDANATTPSLPTGGLYVFLQTYPNYSNTVIDGVPIDNSASQEKLRLGIGFMPSTQNTEDASAPHAYIKYIFYDKDHHFIRKEIKYVQLTASQPAGMYLSLPDLIAEQSGYVEVFVANESNRKVWFDDLTITHTPTLIVQENHYEPYGMNLVGIEGEGKPEHRHQYNGLSEKVAYKALHWYMTDYRGYDSQLGMFEAYDPLATSVAGISPYQYGYNNPVNYNDPDGLLPINYTGPKLPSSYSGWSFSFSIGYSGGQVYTGFGVGTSQMVGPVQVNVGIGFSNFSGFNYGNLQGYSALPSWDRASAAGRGALLDGAGGSYLASVFMNEDPDIGDERINGGRREHWNGTAWVPSLEGVTIMDLRYSPLPKTFTYYGINYPMMFESGFRRTLDGPFWRANDFHYGNDYHYQGASGAGVPVYATHSGYVRVYQGVLTVESDNGLVRTVYGHMYPSSFKVEEGAYIAQGTQVGEIGAYGTDGAHLHYEIQYKVDKGGRSGFAHLANGWWAINPLKYTEKAPRTAAPFSNYAHELVDPNVLIHTYAVRQRLSGQHENWLSNRTFRLR